MSPLKDFILVNVLSRTHRVDLRLVLKSEERRNIDMDSDTLVLFKEMQLSPFDTFRRDTYV